MAGIDDPTVPSGEIYFVLSLNPKTLEFGLEPIEKAEKCISNGYDYHNQETGEISTLPDPAWAYYANKVGEIIKAGKEATLPTSETETSTSLDEYLKAIEV